MLGRGDVARERMARAMAAANENNPHELAYSEFWAELLRVNLVRNTSKARHWQRGRSNFRKNINFRRLAHFLDVFSVTRERNLAAPARVLR